jgi:DNA-binding IclR family transcriptional regulator
MAPGKPRQQGIQSIEVGHDLLLALARAPQPLTLGELAKAAKMSAPKAHRYLVSYGRMGLVEQESESGRYDLGAFALRLGLAALGRLEPVNIARRGLRDLAEELQQTAAIAVWANHGATIVGWVDVDSPVSATLRVGSVMPLSRSATGMLFLANLPATRSTALLKSELAENVRNHQQPQTQSELESKLKIIRRDGYAHTSSFIKGITGMAAPVFSSDGSMVLALVTLGYSDSFDTDIERIKTVLLSHTKKLSLRLGAAGNV